MWSNPQFPAVLVHSGVSRSELHGAEAVPPNPKILFENYSSHQPDAPHGATAPTYQEMTPKKNLNFKYSHYYLCFTYKKPL